MPMDTTKRQYILLRVFKDAAEQGLTLEEISPRMQAASQAVFQTEDYVIPEGPLESMLDSLCLIEHLEESDGRYVITQAGLDDLAYTEENYINQPADTEESFLNEPAGYQPSP